MTEPSIPGAVVRRPLASGRSLRRRGGGRALGASDRATHAFALAADGLEHRAEVLLGARVGFFFELTIGVDDGRAEFGQGGAAAAGAAGAGEDQRLAEGLIETGEQLP